MPQWSCRGEGSDDQYGLADVGFKLQLTANLTCQSPIDALALAWMFIHAQRVPAAVDPHVVRNRRDPKIPVWIMGAPSDFDCQQLPARPRLCAK